MISRYRDWECKDRVSVIPSKFFSIFFLLICTAVCIGYSQVLPPSAFLYTDAHTGCNSRPVQTPEHKILAGKTKIRMNLPNFF